MKVRTEGRLSTYSTVVVQHKCYLIGAMELDEKIALNRSVSWLRQMVEAGR